MRPRLRILVVVFLKVGGVLLPVVSGLGWVCGWVWVCNISGLLTGRRLKI